MKLFLNRFHKGSEYTIGRLYINDEYFCDTLEDVDRNLNQNMLLDEIKKIKINGETAIPTGTYKITLNVQSPKYKTYKQYSFCNGYLPRLLDVPGYDGVLIHIGNYPKDSLGCILVGHNDNKGMVCNSTATFKKLYEILVNVPDTEEIEITII